LPDTPQPSRRAIYVELALLYLGTCLAIRGIRAAKDGLGLSDNWLVLVPVVFLYAPVLAERFHRYRVDPDITWPEPFRPSALRALKWLLFLIAVIYPPFVIGNHIVQSWGLPWFTREILELRTPYPAHRPWHGLPDDLWLQVPYQLICIGYAEEYFYRGYMQTRIDGLWTRRFRLFGAEFGWSLPVVAVAFTVGHSIVTWQWWQPFILFPALLFGWLRARTGDILAGTLFHAWSNTAMIVLDSIYGVR
jgi:membrane protease YdiL (CAAX protease family)